MTTMLLGCFRPFDWNQKWQENVIMLKTLNLYSFKHRGECLPLSWNWPRAQVTVYQREGGHCRGSAYVPWAQLRGDCTPICCLGKDACPSHRGEGEVHTWWVMNTSHFWSGFSNHKWWTQRQVTGCSGDLLCSCGEGLEFQLMCHRPGPFCYWQSGFISPMPFLWIQIKISSRNVLERLQASQWDDSQMAWFFGFGKESPIFTPPPFLWFKVKFHFILKSTYMLQQATSNLGDMVHLR